MRHNTTLFSAMDINIILEFSLHETVAVENEMYNSDKVWLKKIKTKTK